MTPANRIGYLASTGLFVVGDMALQRIGILGYGVGLPVAAWVLSRFFCRIED